jgi:hypothetical protein
MNSLVAVLLCCALVGVYADQWCSLGKDGPDCSEVYDQVRAQDDHVIRPQGLENQKTARRSTADDFEPIVAHKIEITFIAPSNNNVTAAFSIDGTESVFTQVTLEGVVFSTRVTKAATTCLPGN